MERFGTPYGMMRRMTKDYDSPCVLAFKDGELLGWSAMHYVCDPPEVHVFVLEEHRRKGIGSLVFNHLVQCENTPKVWTVGQNERGSAFYGKFSCAQVERYSLAYTSELSPLGF